MAVKENKESEASKPENGRGRERKWIRTRTDRELFGVCSALAKDLEYPVWLVRLVFLLLMPVFALPLLAYIALIFVIPGEPKSEEEKNRAPLFRRCDLVSAGITFLVMMVGYWFSLAPDLTLEDSGELAVGSMYAGVPHPPGYPVWTLYTWLFTKIPFSNIAWRVALSSAFAGAVACGLIALMVSRGTSFFIRSIDMFEHLEEGIERQLTAVAGIVAGALMGFNGFMWSQAVIVEVYTPSVLSLVGTLFFLQKWIYQPERKSQLYWAMFLFGICFTNHQTLVVAAIGIEVLILLRNEKLGRDLFFFNSIIFVLGLLYKAKGESKTLNNPIIFKIYLLIGTLSIALCAYYAFKTEGLLKDHWCTSVLMGFAYLGGGSFYLYMPLASLTNPPMNWGYPRTKDGFLHALTRGQYESANPTSDPGRFFQQVIEYFRSAGDEFNVIYLFLALIPFLLFLRLRKRERAWLGGLTAIYACLAFLLLILLNPAPDRQSATLNRVFFTASHVMIAMFIGYAVAVIGAISLTHYRKWRFWLIGGALISVAWNAHVLLTLESQLPIYNTAAMFALALSLTFFCLFAGFFHGPPPRALMIAMVLMPLHSALQHWWDNEERGHLFGYWFGHDMFSPPFEDETGTPIYPEMAKHAVLFGGTDPGRFNPTYMIFCESFIDPEDRRDPEFDRRDVYLITQNALADGTYLQYIRAHYNRSTQEDPPFFQDVLRTMKERERNVSTRLIPRMVAPLDRLATSIGDSIEKDRRIGSSWFEDDHFINAQSIASRLQAQQDPFSKWLSGELSEETKGILGSGDEDDIADALTEDFNRIIDRDSIYTNERFSGITLTSHVDAFVKEDPKGHTRIRLNRLLLEQAFPDAIEKSPGGLYPDREINTPTPGDSQTAFQQYVEDAQRRMAKGQLRPGENVTMVGDRLSVSGQAAVMAINAILTKIIFDKNPDHEFYVEESFPLDWMYPHLTPYGIIMKINRNPLPELTPEILAKDRAFWSKYSERLIGNWITPDTPVQEIVDFAERVYIKGNFYAFEGDTTFVRDDNAKKAFSKLRSAIAGLYIWRINQSKTVPEQQRMIRETEFALKQAYAFCPYSPEALVKYVSFLAGFGRNAEAYKLIELSLKMDPQNDMMLNFEKQFRVHKDQPIGAPTRPSIPENIKKSATQAVQAPTSTVAPAAVATNPTTVSPAPATAGANGQPATRRQQIQQMIERMAADFEANPTNLNVGFQLASYYTQLRQTNEASELLKKILLSTNVEPGHVAQIAQIFGQLGNPVMMERSLVRLTQVAPGVPEPWFDLAATQGAIGNALSQAGMKTEGDAKNEQALQSLAVAIQLNAPLAAEGKAKTDLKAVAAKDPRFQHLVDSQEFQRIIGK